MSFGAENVKCLRGSRSHEMALRELKFCMLKCYSLSQPCEFKASGADLIFVCFFHHKLHGCMPWGEVCLLP